MFLISKDATERHVRELHAEAARRRRRQRLADLDLDPALRGLPIAALYSALDAAQATADGASDGRATAHAPC